jgi:hypothetical protein
MLKVYHKASDKADAFYNVVAVMPLGSLRFGVLCRQVTLL